MTESLEDELQHLDSEFKAQVSAIDSQIAELVARNSALRGRIGKVPSNNEFLNDANLMTPKVRAIKRMIDLPTLVQEATRWGIDPSAYQPKVDELTVQQTDRFKDIDTKVAELRVSDQQRKVWQAMHEYDSSGAWKSQTSAEMQARLTEMGIIKPAAYQAKWAELNTWLEKELQRVEIEVQNHLLMPHHALSRLVLNLICGGGGSLIGLLGTYAFMSPRGDDIGPIIYIGIDPCVVALPVTLGGGFLGLYLAKRIMLSTRRQEFEEERKEWEPDIKKLEEQYEEARKSTILEVARQVTRGYVAKDAEIAKLLAEREKLPADILAAKRQVIVNTVREAVQAYWVQEGDIAHLTHEGDELRAKYEKKRQIPRISDLELSISKGGFEKGAQAQCNLSLTNSGVGPAKNLELTIDGPVEVWQWGKVMKTIKIDELATNAEASCDICLKPLDSGSVVYVIKYSCQDILGRPYQGWKEFPFDVAPEAPRVVEQIQQTVNLADSVVQGSIVAKGDVIRSLGDMITQDKSNRHHKPSSSRGGAVTQNVYAKDSVVGGSIVGIGNVISVTGNMIQQMATRARLCEERDDFEQARRLYLRALEGYEAARKQDLPPEAVRELQQLRSQVEFYRGKVKELEGQPSQRFVIPGDGYAIAIIEPGVHPATLTPQAAVAARNCIEGKPSLEDGLRSIFDWVRNNIAYGAHRPTGVGYRDGAEVQKAHEGVCGEQAFAYMAMARSVNIRCNFMLVDRDCYGKPVTHACVRFQSPREFSSDSAYNLFDVQREAGRDHSGRIVPDIELFQKFGQWRGTLN